MNTKKGLIGVIVPVYKVEKYIAECIESILAQTYTNFRLILVDDGTPDNAGRICDEYAKKDSRITVIHQENAGVTRARARGVEEANDCEYITFVDGDDQLLSTALEKYSKLINEDTDIVLSTTFRTEERNRVFIDNWEQLCDRLPIKDFRKSMIRLRGGMPWGRCFRRTIIDKFAFETPRDIYFGEDAIMNLRISLCTQKDIITTSDTLYLYRQHTSSVCSNFNYKAQYLESLYMHLKNSIPIDYYEEYEHSYIRSRVDLWRTLLNNRIRISEWANTQFHREIKQDIKKHKSQLEIFDHVLLYYTSPIIRYITITIRKALNFTHYLKSFNRE